MVGPSALHGPHHVAEKSTSTGVLAFCSVDLKLTSVSSVTFDMLSSLRSALGRVSLAGRAPILARAIWIARARPRARRRAPTWHAIAVRNRGSGPAEDGRS